MEEKVINIISSITKIKEVELKNSLDKENLWNSLNRVEIIIAIEDEFDISFSQEEISEMKTISQIYEAIKGKM